MEIFGVLSECALGQGYLLLIMFIVMVALVIWLLMQMDENQKLKFGVDQIYNDLTPAQQDIIDHGWYLYIHRKDSPDGK